MITAVTRGLSLLEPHSLPLVELLALGHRARAHVDEQRLVLLSVRACSDAGLVLGRWMSAAPEHFEGPVAGIRASGGPALWVPANSLIATLALAHDSALLDTPRDRLLNRNVRGFLRGLAANYFGAETIAREGRPIGVLGWSRDAQQRVVIELFVGIDEPVRIIPLDRNRVPMRGIEPVGVRALGVADSPHELGRRIVAAHARFGVVFEAGEEPLADAVSLPVAEDERVTWGAVEAGPIGQLQLGRTSSGDLQLRGECYADEDFPGWLAEALNHGELTTVATRAIAEGRIEGIDADALTRAARAI